MRRLLFIPPLLTAVLAAGATTAPAAGAKGSLKLVAQTQPGKVGKMRVSSGCKVVPNGLKRNDMLMDCRSGRLATATYTFSLPSNVASTVQPHVSIDVLRDGGHTDSVLVPVDKRHVAVTVSARQDARIDVRQVSISFYVRT